MNNIICIIPARGGSKGIPKKNLAIINGKPLLEYTFDAARNSKYPLSIYLTSDDDDILNFAKINNVDILKRPAELALDNSLTDDAIFHFIKNQNINNQAHILLLQPTSPLRTSIHIDEAIYAYINKYEKNLSLISMVKSNVCVQKSFYIKENRAKGLFGNDSPFSPRQSFNKTYFANGAIYLFNVEDFMETAKIPRENILPYQMNEQDSTDIDTIEDLKKVEQIMEQL